MMELPPPEVVEWCRAVVAAADARAAAPTENEMSGDPRAELTETEAADLARVKPDVLRRHRDRGSASTWRRVGRNIFYVTADFEAWAASGKLRRSPDSEP